MIVLETRDNIKSCLTLGLIVSGLFSCWLAFGISFMRAWNRLSCWIWHFYSSRSNIQKMPWVSLSIEELILGLPDVAENSSQLYSAINFSTSSILHCLGHREPPKLQYKMQEFRQGSPTKLGKLPIKTECFLSF